MTTILGEEMQVAVYAVRGSLHSAGAVRLLEVAVRLIGMRPLKDQSAVWHYPMEDGVTGGVGQTVAMPLVESIGLIMRPASLLSWPQRLLRWLLGRLRPGVAVTDSWGDHDGFYIILASCRLFDAGRLARHLTEMGWDVSQHDKSYVSLMDQHRRRPLGRHKR